MPTLSAREKKAQINEHLKETNRLLFGEDSRLELYYALLDEIREQDINANVMTTGMFNQLTQNIAKNKQLESVPLAATKQRTPDVIEMVSGHHRLRAAKQANLDGILVLLYRGITPSELRAKQLAHNSIQGKSDPEIVQKLFEEIEEIDHRMESFIDPADFDNQIPQAMEFEMVDIDLMADAKTVTVVFLPTQAADFAKAAELLTDSPDTVYVAHREAFDGFKAACLKVQEELDVVSIPTAIAAMARLAMERLEQIRQDRNSTGNETSGILPESSFSEDALERSLAEAHGHSGL